MIIPHLAIRIQEALYKRTHEGSFQYYGKYTEYIQTQRNILNKITSLYEMSSKIHTERNQIAHDVNKIKYLY